MRVQRALWAPVVLVLSTFAVVARAQAVEAGQLVPEATLRRVDGGPTPLFERAAGATALVFFRVDHERSAETLRMLAACQPRLAGKPVRIVGLVPADSAGLARAQADAAGARFPILVDEEDAIYAALRVRTHPGIAVVDRSRRVVTFEPYHPVGYCDLVVAWLRRALGEIGDAEVAKVVAPAPSELPGKNGDLSRRHVAFGRRLLATRSYASAHDYARKAIAAAPTADAWWLEGEIFVAEQKCEDAERAFAAAAALDPARSARPACGR